MRYAGKILYVETVDGPVPVLGSRVFAYFVFPDSRGTRIIVRNDAGEDTELQDYGTGSRAVLRRLMKHVPELICYERGEGKNMEMLAVNSSMISWKDCPPVCRFMETGVRNLEPMGGSREMPGTLLLDSRQYSSLMEKAAARGLPAQVYHDGVEINSQPFRYKELAGFSCPGNGFICRLYAGAAKSRVLNLSDASIIIKELLNSGMFVYAGPSRENSSDMLFLNRSRVDTDWLRSGHSRLASALPCRMLADKISGQMLGISLYEEEAERLLKRLELGRMFLEDDLAGVLPVITPDEADVTLTTGKHITLPAHELKDAIGKAEARIPIQLRTAEKKIWLRGIDWEATASQPIRFSVLGNKNPRARLFFVRGGAQEEPREEITRLMAQAKECGIWTRGWQQGTRMNSSTGEMFDLSDVAIIHGITGGSEASIMLIDGTRQREDHVPCGFLNQLCDKEYGWMRINARLSSWMYINLLNIDARLTRKARPDGTFHLYGVCGSLDKPLQPAEAAAIAARAEEVQKNGDKHRRKLAELCSQAASGQNRQSA